MTTRIVLADDHRMFRDGLRALLGAHDGLEVVGEAQDGLEAIDLVGRLLPDVLILDLAMPGLHGIEVARRLAQDHPRTRIVVLSMHSDRRYVVEALRAGAAAYVLKESGFSELSGVIAEVQAGRLYLSPAVSAQVIKDYIRLAEADEGSAFAVLSAREREVLQLLAAGRATKEIAGELHLSVKTVETHRKTVMDKLGIHSIAELTKYAIREGLTPLE
ncbi:MAG TPA: response regulator transcription factor [Candidatus Krumholzibacteria bacterium]|nr:response regulator transcription factor [Candidatus Krumholzibacteria bacterium]